MIRSRGRGPSRPSHECGAGVLGERPARTLALLVGLWTAVGFFAGVQVYFLATLEGRDASLAAGVVDQTLSALAWLPTTVVAIALTHRFSVRAPAWRGPLAIHAAAGVVLGFATNVLIHLLHGLADLDAAALAPGGLLSSGLSGLARWVHVDVLAYALIAAVAHAVRLRRRARGQALRAARLEADLTSANLRALKLQLQPHFLFNTLHAAGGLWRTGRGDAAQEVLERLSTMLRRILDPGVGHEVTLEEELEIVGDYLAIEAIRLGDRLRLEIDVDENALGAYVPSFALQPLVENAVRHGIEPDVRAGRIAIRARRSEGELRLEVCDDGVGMDPDAARSDRAIGVRNTRRRLRELYGGDRLELTAPASGGTRVLLRLPFRADDGVAAAGNGAGTR